MSLRESLPPAWRSLLADELALPYVRDLERFLDDERAAHAVFPAAEEIFTAFALTPPDAVRVLILGQDPYHRAGQAHGLSFSVKPGVKPPPSLVNLYKELSADLGVTPPSHGHLAGWAAQGVLLLNAVMTVREHAPGSHRDRGWERFTDAVIRRVGETQAHVVFVLLGGYARKKARLVDADRHAIIEGAHPSPLSAHGGFFGSRPFSRINQALRAAGAAEIDWRLD